MPNIITKQFNKYRVHYKTGGATNRHFALIQCFDGNTVVGQLIFLDSPAALPSPRANASTAGPLNIFFSIERFSAVVDLLRNEGPLEISLDGEIGILSNATVEPVGEGE
jgi:hypothetical protein